MPSAPPSPSGTSGEPTEVDLLLRLARRWRSLGTGAAAGAPGAPDHGLSPHQERALLAVARLVRRAEHGAAVTHGGSAEPSGRGSAEPGRGAEKPSGRGSAEPGRGSAEHPSPVGVRVSHLADHLGIAPRSATEVADALESAGLLSRSPDPTDRRAVLLALTEEGWHTVARVRDRRRAAADLAVAALSPHDRAELRRLLEALLAGP